METVTIEAKLTPKLLEELENIVKEGWYTDRSEAIRDAVRKLTLERRLEEEKARYQALLKEITERQTTLDVLNYIDKLDSEEEIDARKISSELGYKEETVQEVLKNILKER